jgi:hypothetical protein
MPAKAVFAPEAVAEARFGKSKLVVRVDVVIDPHELYVRWPKVFKPPEVPPRKTVKKSKRR